jgi:hypothetical protein
MWSSRTKNDLIIEVWEKLDCENIGLAEIEAIELVVAEQYGQLAVDPPMVIARLLADEGAELRHSELMELHVERASDRPYDAALRNIIDMSSLKTTAASIKRLRNLRKQYVREGDREGLRLLIETARKKRRSALQQAAEPNGDHYAEAAEWLRIWMENPEVFEPWFSLRIGSTEFRNRFGDLE